MGKILRAPAAVNLEITDVCNVKCRHCYNFWRASESSFYSMTKKSMDRLLDILIDAGVFHVVFTGGEPFSKFDILKFGLNKALKNNISVSCNSNLMLATEDKLKQLREIGLDHILTSLNSHNPDTNDYMLNSKGAFNKIVKGIESGVKHGIKISLNMIVSQRNKGHVYETGKLAYRLGCQKIFGTRVIPSANLENTERTEFRFTKDDAFHTLNQLLRVKKETGIMIGTLVSYPLCLLNDLKKYTDFVGRGCPGQSGHLMSINANGDTHACVHEVASHGNIFEIGIYEAYRNMKTWYTKNYRYKGCEDCYYIDICRTGCRMLAHAYFGKYTERDPLMVDKENFSKPYKIVYDESIYKKIDDGLKFIAPKRLRFRKEEGFYLLNIRWTNTIRVTNDVAQFLIQHRDSGEEFDVNTFGRDKRETLAELFFKDAVVSGQVTYEDLRSKVGFSADPSDLKQERLT